MPKQRAKKVFISSTVEDLKPYRAAVKEAVTSASLHPDMQEDFKGGDQRMPYNECMARVDAADAVVVIVAHRYGWVPPDQPGPGGKSITWLECERAKGKKPIFAFEVDPDHNWPFEQKEDFEFVRVGQHKSEFTMEEVQQRVARLAEFKQWLGSNGIRHTFTTTENLRRLVSEELLRWSPPAQGFAGSTTAWLTATRNLTAYIEIRDLKVGSGGVYRFPIDDLYVPLMSTRAPGRPAARDHVEHLAEPVRLEEALQQRRLVIVGAPGSGKTTFLRRIANALAVTRLGEAPEAAKERIGLDEGLLPVFLRVSDLAEHRSNARGHEGAPTREESPAWLPHCLAVLSHEEGWELNQDQFEKLLEEGKAIVLLDGLDEAPDRKEREAIVAVFQNAVDRYKNSRFVVTTRPKAYEEIPKLAEFAEVQVSPLEQEAVLSFLEKWSRGLYPEDEAAADRHRDELNSAIRDRFEIRRMARNPVMLTALAALYWKDRRLPEARAELYDSILTNLLRSRQNRPGRVGEEVATRRLSRLALAMQDHPQGRQVQMGRRDAAEAIAAEFAGDVDRAENFLKEEEIDSGVLTNIGRHVRFWHLTFQEYLAAKAIGGLANLEEQVAILVEDGRLYTPEWRETALLFAGVLFRQGKDVDKLIGALLARLPDNAGLAEKARCAGMVGAMVRDLVPYGFEPKDRAYLVLLGEAKAIFDAERSPEIPIDIRTEAADALGQVGDDRFADDEALWVTIPGAKFWMGAQRGDSKGRNYDPEAGDYDGEVRQVEVKTFKVRRFPVTVQEYEKFVGAGGYEDQQWWTAGGFGDRNEPGRWEEQLPYKTRPVTDVSWYEAIAYCTWRGWRLPTEEEWELAARGPESRRYPWGQEPPDPLCANFERNVGHVTPVGLYPAGRTPDHGLEEIAGNVWEWCSRSEDEFMSIRGGSWDYDAAYLRCAVRVRSEPGIRYSVIGFRCVREVSP